MVKYKYDAWGKCKALNADGFEIPDNNHIGILNPFRSGDMASQQFVEGKSFDDINLGQSVSAGILNAVLSIPAIGASRMVRNSNITNFQSFLFGLGTNTPLIGLSTIGNYCISEITPLYTINDFKKNIFLKMLNVISSYAKENTTKQKGFYYVI